METLHLNEKRIHHIFDILHGKDVQEQTDQSYVAHYQKKPNNQKINPIEYHKKAKSPRLDTSLFIK